MSIMNPLSIQPRPGHEFATLGGGCFWCLEAVYRELQGVIDVESGYSGGHVRDPRYREVCSGQTGHAEVVRIEFDPQMIRYRQILEVFFVIHDATTLNRQGNDVGTQYRSVIFFHSHEQEWMAQQVLEELSKWASEKIVTQLLPATDYWRAEDEHQEYFVQHPNQAYCAMVIVPKMQKFKQTFAQLHRPI